METILPAVGQELSSVMTTDAPAPALACAEQVPVQAEVVRHPATALYDQVFEAVLPPLVEFAARKNVPLQESEHAPVARYALEKLSRRTLRGILKLEPRAIACVQVALSHALDVLTTARVISVIRALEGKEPTSADLISLAEAAVKEPSANDKAPGMYIWPDVVTIVANHFARIKGDARLPTVTLPAAAMRRTTVTAPCAKTNEVGRSC